MGADKNYDTQEFVASCRGLNITPHVAQNNKRSGGSAIDGRTTRHAGYAASQKVRKRIEEGFGWGKTIGLIRQVKVRGLARVNAVFGKTFIGWKLRAGEEGTAALRQQVASALKTSKEGEGGRGTKYADAGLAKTEHGWAVTVVTEAKRQTFLVKDDVFLGMLAQAGFVPADKT